MFTEVSISTYWVSKIDLYKVDIRIGEVKLGRKRAETLDFDIRHFNFEDPSELGNGQLSVVIVLLGGHNEVSKLDYLVVKSNVRVPDHTGRLGHPRGKFLFFLKVKFVVC